MSDCSSSTLSYQELKLFPYQIDHVNRLQSILEKSPFALDLSMLGTGKTFTSSKIALNRNVKHIIVIAPVSVLQKWKIMKEEYGIPIHSMISYQSMRSCRNAQPKHGLLKRIDTTEIANMTVMKIVNFCATESYRQLLAEGTLLILDEIQNLKNLSTQFSAARELLRPIIEEYKRYPNSRALLLSGSPIDKEVQALHMFKCLHIMKSPNISIYNPGMRITTHPGFDEITCFCQNLLDNVLVPTTTTTTLTLDGDDLFRRKSKALISQHVDSAREAKSATYKLFQGIFKTVLSSSMLPPTIPHKLTMVNGFFEVQDEEDKVQLSNWVGELATAVGFNERTSEAQINSNSMGTLTIALKNIEMYKLNTMIRVVDIALRSNPNRKVVVCVNYKSSLAALNDEFSEYNPLLLHGSVSQDARARVVNAFQEPNVRHRLLISNLTVCSTGIDLDDKYGMFPRICFVSPMFNTITLYQLGHRFHRMDTKSPAQVYLFYGDGFKEAKIINALARKGQVMKETTELQVKAGVVFPGDLPEFREVIPCAAKKQKTSHDASVVVPPPNTDHTTTNHTQGGHIYI